SVLLITALATGRTSTLTVLISVLPVLAKLVIFFSVFLFTQYLVGFVNFFKTGFGILVIGINIGMVFTCQLLIGFFNFCLGGGFVDTQYFIVVFILHGLFYV